MAFDDYEESADSGKPLDLYTWTGPEGVILRETSGGTEVDLGGGVVFTPSAVSRPPVESDADHNAQGGIDVEAPPDHAVVLRHRSLAPNERITLRIQQKHRGDAEVIGAWLGIARAVTYVGDRTLIRCEPIPGSYRRPGLRIAYERKCPYHLYEANTCRLSAATFKVDAVVGSFAGATITATAFGALASGYLNGGEVVIGFDRRLVIDHTGSVVTLNQPFSSLAAGDALEAYPGCDRLKATCIAKFNNLVNFGGFPWMPDKNPFEVGLDG